jgi:hypothetical protein
MFDDDPCMFAKVVVYMTGCTGGICTLRFVWVWVWVVRVVADRVRTMGGGVSAAPAFPKPRLVLAVDAALELDVFGDEYPELEAKDELLVFEFGDRSSEWADVWPWVGEVCILVSFGGDATP